MWGSGYLFFIVIQCSIVDTHPPTAIFLQYQHNRRIRRRRARSYLSLIQQCSNLPLHLIGFKNWLMVHANVWYWCIGQLGYLMLHISLGGNPLDSSTTSGKHVNSHFNSYFWVVVLVLWLASISFSKTGDRIPTSLTISKTKCLLALTIWFTCAAITKENLLLSLVEQMW